MADLEQEVQRARAYLMKSSGAAGLNIYDHFTNVIGKLLDQRPENAVDIIEDISKEIKADAFKSESTLKDFRDKTQEVQLATVQVKLFKSANEEDGDDVKPVVPDIMESARHFEDGGVGLGREETFRIFLALKSLAEANPLKIVRFWGKLFGVERNYIVAEAEYKEGEEPQIEAVEDPVEPDPAAEEGTPEDTLPKSQYVRPPDLPAEALGAGANKKTYFVCNEAGHEWTALPNVTPAQIVVSRKIKKFLTGRLDAPVNTYPPFPGNESNYLRAQIARISSDTHVSPQGFYSFDEDAEEEEGGRDSFIVDPQFEGKSRSELLDPALTGWVKHMQYILPQGRCKWIKPEDPKKAAKDGEEEAEEEEDEAAVEPETGPQLLSPLQNDPDVGGQPAWSPRVASALKGPYSAVVIASNRWPGAFAYALSKQFENIYIGWGHEFSVEAYNPPLPPLPQTEFADGDTIVETADPTREEEAAYEATLVEKAEAENPEEGEGDGAGDEEEADD